MERTHYTATVEHNVLPEEEVRSKGFFVPSQFSRFPPPVHCVTSKAKERLCSSCRFSNGEGGGHKAGVDLQPRPI
jgi:hypothetical protein